MNTSCCVEASKWPWNRTDWTWNVNQYKHSKMSKIKWVVITKICVKKKHSFKNRNILLKARTMNLYVRCTTQFERPRTVQEMTVIWYLICINYTRKYTFALKARKHKCINVMHQWSLFNILRKPLNSSGNDSLYHLMQRREQPK